MSTLPVINTGRNTHMSESVSGQKDHSGRLIASFPLIHRLWKSVSSVSIGVEVLHILSYKQWFYIHLQRGIARTTPFL